MKVHIAYRFREGAYGGANQFLKGLRDHFTATGRYAEKIDHADVVLINANPDSINMKMLGEVFIQPNRKYAVVLRLDGVLSRYRPLDMGFDNFVTRVLAPRVDGLIFQSEWGKLRLREWGLIPNKHEVTIINAPDPGIFFVSNNKPADKTRIIASSWSPNPRKGFDILDYLDRNLDWERFSMSFVGNSPIRFKNITHYPVMTSHELANILREHDIFFTATADDTCSNSLIEAMHCGLPTVALDSGGSPEIVKRGGLLFRDAAEGIKAILEVANKLDVFRAGIEVPTISEASSRYLEFMEKVLAEKVMRSQIGCLAGYAALVMGNGWRILRRKCFDPLAAIR